MHLEFVRDITRNQLYLNSSLFISVKQWEKFGKWILMSDSVANSETQNPSAFCVRNLIFPLT